MDDVIDDVMDRITALPAPAYSFLVIRNYLGCGQPMRAAYVLLSETAGC